MVDLAGRDRLASAFETLLDDLSGTWPASDIAYVRDVAGHFEFDDALENLVALGRRNGLRLDAAQRRMAIQIAVDLGSAGSTSLALLGGPPMAAKAG